MSDKSRQPSNLYSRYSKVKGILFPVLIFISYKSFLYFVEKLSIIIPHSGTTLGGNIPWANFDGVHYLSIAKEGYHEFEQAFFPLFPILINQIYKLFGISFLDSALIVVNTALFLSTIVFWRLSRIDFSTKTASWTTLFFLSFPTAFFLGTVYTESLFLLFLFGSFYAARKKRWLAAGVFGALASSTRFVGVFLLPALIIEFFSQKNTAKSSLLHSAILLVKKSWGIFLVPIGLLSYIFYLAISANDPLAFMHVQPAFGAQRSGNEIILLPQVVWRYFAIFLSIPTSNYDFWKAFLEFIMFFLVLFFLYLSFKQKVRFSYIVFSLLALLFPTLSGTLSSIPRYSLVCFVLFIFFATIKNFYIRVSILVLSLASQIIFSSLFLRGYFVG